MHATLNSRHALEQRYQDAHGDIYEFGDNWIWFVPSDVKHALRGNGSSFGWIHDPPQVLVEALMHALGTDLGQRVQAMFEKAYRAGLAKQHMSVNSPQVHTNWISAVSAVCYDAAPTVRQVVSLGVEPPNGSACLIEAAEGGCDVHGGALLDAVGVYALGILA